MSSRANRARAIEETYLDDLRRSLSCVTDAVLIRRTSGGTQVARRAELSRNPTLLRVDPRLGLLFSQTFTVQPTPDNAGWSIVILGYRYELLDADESELLAYHWHPFGHSPVILPHLHVTNRHPAIDLSKTHLPTGVVSPNAILRCLITEFGVEPLRPDWDEILRDA